MSVDNELKKVTDSINKKFRKNSKSDEDLVTVASEKDLKPVWVPTNAPELNNALGGGFAKGTMIAVHGVEGSGKTSIALSIAAEIQREGGYVLFINTEGAYDAVADLVGLDREKTLYADPKDYGEQLIDIVDHYLYDSDTKGPRRLIDCVIVDSINGLVPKAVIDKFEDEGSEGVTMARRAKMITDFLERMRGRGMLRAGCIVVLIAQDRANISGYGAASTMSGGYAVKYMPDMIINFSKKPIAKVEKGERRIVGHDVVFNIEKNKVLGKLASGRYSVLYGVGIDDSESLMVRAIEFGYIVGEGRSTYRIILPGGDYIIKGKAELAQTIKTDITIKEKIREVLRAGKPKIPPVSSGTVLQVEEIQGDNLEND